MSVQTAVDYLMICCIILSQGFFFKENEKCTTGSLRGGDDKCMQH